MKSFRDPATDVLTGWGYVDSNGDHLIRDEEDGFNLEPGAWKLVGDTWQPYVDQNAIIRAQIDALEAEAKMAPPIRTALLAMSQFVAQLQAAQATAAGKPTTTDQLLAQNIEYQEVLAVDNQVKALEAKLT